MNDFKTILGLIAAIVSIFCYLPYIITTIQGKTKPNIATWLTWTILSIVVTATMFAERSFNTLWVPLIGAFGQGIIALLALKQGKGSWSNFDLICLFFVGLGLAFWWHYDEPMIALSMALAVDLVGVLPTFKKSYQEPESENMLTWVLYLISSIFLIFSVETWNSNDSLFFISDDGLFSMYLFSVNFIIVALLIRGKAIAATLKT